MLPRLDRLALVRTAGFYALTEAEQQQVEQEEVTDPITLGNPTVVMTFRIQMDAPNPDGTPRYKFYNPEELWKWMRQDRSEGKLPHNPSQKITRRDWFRLHDHYAASLPLETARVPEWVSGLERQEQFDERMRMLEEEIKQRLREEWLAKRLVWFAMNALQDGRQWVSLGIQAVVRWRFWIKYEPAQQQYSMWSATKQKNETFESMRLAFSRLLGDMAKTYPEFKAGYETDNWVKEPRAGLVIQPVADKNLVGLTFGARLRETQAQFFLRWANEIIAKQGYDDFIRRANRFDHALSNPESYGCLNDLPRIVQVDTEAMDETIDCVPILTEEEYNAWQGWYAPLSGGPGSYQYPASRMSRPYPDVGSKRRVVVDPDDEEE